MKRRNFIKNSTVASASLLSLNSFSSENNNIEKHVFNLKYAPHFGMFKSHAGSGIIDQLKFMSDQGFSAFEDNGMKNRDTKTQEKIGNFLIGSHILLLETRGVVTNKIRKTPLTYAKTEKGYVVAASYGGRDETPQWFSNLQDNLNYITVENIRMRVKHEIIPLEDRKTYWDELVKVYKTFDQYKERTERDIPLVEFIKV